MPTLPVDASSPVIPVEVVSAAYHVLQNSQAKTALPVTPLALTGGKTANHLVGGAGDDRLDGRLGRDTLTGGDGKDVFAFTTKLKNNVDVITDFDAAADTLQLAKGIFKLHKGALDKSAFRIGSKALDADDRILFNAKTGALSYDADGSGTTHKAITFAQIKNPAAVKALLGFDDFVIA